MANFNCLHASLTFKIFENSDSLPSDWDEVAAGNIFLSRDYLNVLDVSSPENMQCWFIGIFNDDVLIGVAVSQFLDFTKISSFGERDNCFKNTIRTFFFKRFSSRVLLLGNNMLTGQNAFRFKQKPGQEHLKIICLAIDEICKRLAKRNSRPHLIIWKDFAGSVLDSFKQTAFDPYYQFSTQPNMVFDIRTEWHSEPEYVSSFVKKYRDQYKRARRKCDGITKRKLNLADIVELEDQINLLYMNVARNAPFNTFYLRKNHFVSLKKSLKSKFRMYGYFEGDKLVGFNTIIVNHEDIDTYFLGYDEDCQKEKMLYLNMLYDMIAYSVLKKYKRIIFARTALEIKSSVGATPLQMFGFIRHQNKFLNYFMSKLFKYFEPELKWQQRHPFRD